VKTLTIPRIRSRKQQRRRQMESSSTLVGANSLSLRPPCIWNCCLLYTGKLKKVSVSKFKGQLLVNFREYYVDKSTGEEKPGSKGITLNRSQWEEFKKVVRLVIRYYYNLKNSVMTMSLNSVPDSWTRCWIWRRRRVIIAHLPQWTWTYCKCEVGECFWNM